MNMRSEILRTHESSNGLADQAFGLPNLIEEVGAWAEDASRLIISTEAQYGLRGIVLSGSGDSYVAGLGAQFAFESLTGVPTSVETAMTTARYHALRRSDSRPFSPLVIVLSNSGEVTRAVEAATAAKARGSRVLAITSNPSSRLATVADLVLATPSRPAPPGPAMSSTAAALLVLHHLAIRSGEVRGRYSMDDADLLRAELRRLGGQVARTLDDAAVAARRVAVDWAAAPHIQTLGSGPSRASAAFASAKFVEATGVVSHHQDIEEYVHLEYFTRDTTGPVLLIAPAEAAAASRAADVVGLLHELGHPVAHITDDVTVADRIPQPTGLREFWQPLAQLAPVALLAGELGVLRGEEPFRGSRGAWAASSGAATVKGGEPDPRFTEREVIDAHR